VELPSALAALSGVWQGAAPATPKTPQHRARTAEETLARIAPLLPSAGVTRLADVTGLDRLGIPVVMAVRPNSRALAVSQGKGPDLAAAKVSSAMEALETWHAERLDWPVRFLRWSEMDGADRAVDPAGLPRLRDGLFHPDKRLPWTAAVDVVEGTDRLVPLELVHTDFTLPPPPGPGCFPMSSNGLASGNTHAEAVLHGLCELIERDALALSLAPGGPRPRRVALDSPLPSPLDAMVGRIEGAGCTLTIEELTSDIGVPVFAATIADGAEAAATAQAAGGFGCHPDRAWACLRAVAEAAQARLTRLAGSRDDLTADWFRHASPPPPESPPASAPVPLAAGPGFQGETVEDDLRFVVAQLTERGFRDILAVDLARPEFGLPVVRVLAPGLEHPPDPDVLPGRRALALR